MDRDPGRLSDVPSRSPEVPVAALLPDRFPAELTILCRSCGAWTHGVPGQVAMCRRCYKTLDLTNQAAPGTPPTPSAALVPERGAPRRAMVLSLLAMAVVAALAILALYVVKA